MNLQQIEK